jgi:glycosyltransferase involved in cell wall biosynthesis
MKLCILLPALNEEKTITSVINRIPTHIDGINEIFVLVIDDGSKDKTVQTAMECGAKVISHRYNKGVGGAFNTGLNIALAAGADIMVNIDADGQFSPEEIPILVEPILSKEADFVIGDRFSQPDGTVKKPKEMSTIKYWGNKQMSHLISMLTNQEFNDVSCGFRAYSKEAMLHLNLTGKFTYTQETFLDLANKEILITSVPIHVKYFSQRKSRVAHNIWIYFYRTVNIILRAYRDYRPLRFFTGLGFLPFIVGAGCGLFTFVHFIRTGDITPYKFLGLLGLYLVSLAFILWIIGILADMFVRIRLYQEQILYHEKKRRYDEDQQSSKLDINLVN